MTMPATTPVLFDRALLAQRQRRAMRAPEIFLLERVVDDMADRLAAVNRAFADVADIWTPGGLQAPFGEGFKTFTRVAAPDSADEALALAPQSLDLALSALAFQSVNDLPGVLAQIRRALRPDGLVLAAMIGGDTLT